MEVISTIEIFILLAIIATCYDLYQIFNFHSSHYKQGIVLSSGSCPWPGNDEFPSNYKMIYKTKEILYKFVSPTTMIFRYNYDLNQIKNLIILKGVGELKNGEIVLTSRFGLITPGVICLLLVANLVLLGRVPNPQEILGAIIVLFFGFSYFFYCRMSADKLAITVVENLAESIKK